MIKDTLKTLFVAILLCSIATNAVAKITQERIDKQVVAVVDDKDITIKDLREFLEKEKLTLRQLVNTEEGIERVLEKKIKEDILYEMAYNSNIKETKKYKEQISLYSNELLLNLYIEAKLAKTKKIKKEYTQKEIDGYMLKEAKKLFNNINELEYYIDTRKKLKGKYVIAKYDDNYISLKEFGKYINMPDLTFERFQRFDKMAVDKAIKLLIVKNLFENEIKKSKLNIKNSKAYLKKFNKIKRKLLIEEYKKLRKKQIKIMGEEARNYLSNYIKNNTRYAYYDIVLQDLYQLKEVYKKIRKEIFENEYDPNRTKQQWRNIKENAFKKFGKIYTIGKNKKYSGFMPFLKATKINQTIREGLERMSIGSVSPNFIYYSDTSAFYDNVLETKEGYHILYLKTKSEPKEDKYEILKALVDKKYKEELDKEIDKIYKNKKIELM